MWEPLALVTFDFTWMRPACVLGFGDPVTSQLLQCLVLPVVATGWLFFVSKMTRVLAGGVTEIREPVSAWEDGQGSSSILDAPRDRASRARPDTDCHFANLQSNQGSFLAKLQRSTTDLIGASTNSNGISEEPLDVLRDRTVLKRGVHV